MDCDRVRRHTPQRAVDRIDRDCEDRIAAYAGRDAAEITRGIAELDREWDMGCCRQTPARWR